jgi:hypothetical protein
MSTIEALEARIRTLEDLEAIRALKARYAVLADLRYGKSVEEIEPVVRELVELFTEDASWDAENVVRVKGKREIYEMFLSPRHVFALHFFKLLDLRLDGDRAWGSWIFFMPATKFDNTAVWQAGREDEEYVKQGGKWLISDLKVSRYFHTAYDQGWARQPMLGYE